MKYYEESLRFGGRAPVALCFALAGMFLLNSPEIVRCAGIMVQGNVNLNGNNVTIDSYNSSDPTESVNGQWAASVSGDSGDVICMGGITNSVSVGNALIYGDLYVGSGTSVNIGANGAVGTHLWVAQSGSGFEAGHLVLNATFPFPNISLPPYGSEGLDPEGGTVVTTKFRSSDDEQLRQCPLRRKLL